jgi:gliding motility-associated-like protein
MNIYKLYRPLLITLLFLCYTHRVFATHYYGIDLYYTHVSGNTYRVSIVSFGDCSGVQFPSFSATRPRIYIRKGNTDIFNDYLDQEPPKEGIEVTSGCVTALKKSTCVDPTGTVPGVKKFIYSKEFTLSGPAPDWKFVYLGETNGTINAGRSVSLTNISLPGVICLEATLDNTQHNNSSPQFSTIATQFNCINSPVTYPPGATDADGDSLVYELIPGLEPPANPVVYQPGFSGSNPLAVTQGTFTFNKSTGLLKYTPNQLQKALVVYRVSEYRNGVLLGSIMREMTIVVLPCVNNIPMGYISNASGATIVDSVTVQTCIGNHELAFDINPTDADNSDVINMTVTGLPKNAKLDITNNNSKQPLSRFVWNMPDLANGDYKFQVTYTDDGCPPSLRTQEYTIRIKPDDIFTETIAADCIRQGFLKLTSPQTWIPWAYTIYKDLTPVYYMGNITTNIWSDSVATGKYRVHAVNYLGCITDTTVEIPSTCYLADLPTAFSPNGDGKNDIFIVRGVNVKEMDLRIYNRWGQLVFQSHDVNKGWDGRFNGQDAPVEAYAFVLSVVFKNSETFQKQGNVTLLR